MLVVSQVLNKILQDKSVKLIKQNNLTEEYFHGFEEEFNFIMEHYNKYGNVPDVTTFLDNFENFQLYEVNESEEYLLDKLYEEYGYHKFVPVIPKISSLVKVDSRDAYNYLVNELPKLKPHTVCRGVDIVANAGERYETYIDRNKNSDTATIKSGLVELDDIFGGWEMGEELVTILARTNQGKCLEKGTKVLMADGSKKKIEDIQIGDYVQSETKVNKVLHLHNGVSNGWLVYNNNDTFERFVVSSQHTLTLFNKKDKKLYDIIIEHFINLPNKIDYMLIDIEGNLHQFEISEIARVEYYGFECDGDHRFYLANGILTHNSWLLMKFLVEAWKQGKRVGLYSGEMSPTKLGYRFDSLYEHFSNRNLTLGSIADGYKEYIDGVKKVPNPFIIITGKELGGRATVSKMRNFVEENKLDILGIDQYSLMDDDRGTVRDQPRIRLSHISEDLFSLSCEYKIPVLGLSQANREGLKKEAEDVAPGLENMKESDDIAHNSSKAIGMKQSSYGLVLDIIKNREGKVGDKLLYSWDIDMGHFSYIPSNGDAARPEIRQQVQQQTKAQFAGSPNPF